MTEDNPMVIIGAGLAGVSACAALRDAGYDGRIVMLNNEKEIPYDRPPLSKSILQGEQDIPDIYLRQPGWYSDNNIELVNDVAVTRIAPDSHELTLSDGNALGYRKLMIATGADVRRIPPLESDTIPHFYLRTDEDAKGLKEFMKPGNKLLLVGAGVIGLETAASALKCGCDVTVVEIADRVMARSMPPVMSTWLQKQHEAQGVTFYMEDSIAEFQGNKVIFKSGAELEPDVMLICAGVVPCMKLAEEAGLACGNGIIVDEFAQTSDPDIYAVGDVAFYPDAWTGAPQRAENWMHAQRQAETAARNMNGAREAYCEIQSVWSDQYDLKIQMAGILDGDQEILRGDMDSGKFMLFWVSNSVIVGVLAVNQAKFMRPIQNLIKDKTRVNVEMLSDPDANLKKIAL
jgi:3-phenylpropionate/trans-cinnamate dioxygenase ferredoxin reductase component